MKKLFTLLIALVAVTAFSCSSNNSNKLSAVLPESPSSVAARTLDLPADYASIHNNVITKSITNNVVITKYVDRAKSQVTETKSASGAIRKTYANAPDRYEASIAEDVNALVNQGTYLLNFLHNAKSHPHVQVDESNPFVLRNNISEFEVNGEDLWTGSNAYVVNATTNPLTVVRTGTPGSNNNVIPKVFVKRVNGVDTYKYPVDYKGAEIIGEDAYNQGATATSIRTNYDNRYVSIKLITKTTTGIGKWSTSNPVWSGGVKIIEDSKNSYAKLNDVLQMLGISEDALEAQLTSTFVCSSRDPNQYVVSTSSDIINTGNTYKGIVYYNGIDASITKPSGKITSYNMAYPGHVVRWIFEAEGVTGARGGLTLATFNSNENNTIQVVQGSTLGFDASSKTLTIDREGTLVFEYEEGSKLTAQGKNWGDRKGVKITYTNKPLV